GKVDRLAVTDDDVLVVDYKTNRPAPEGPAEVPGAYVAQLALYAGLLKPLYPGKRISAALLFTEAPRLSALSDADMAAALARLTRACQKKRLNCLPPHPTWQKASDYRGEADGHRQSR